MLTDIRIMHMPMAQTQRGFRMLETLHVDATGLYFKNVDDLQPVGQLKVPEMQVGVFHKGLFEPAHLQEGLVYIMPELLPIQVSSCGTRKDAIAAAQKNVLSWAQMPHSSLHALNGNVRFEEPRKLIDIMLTGAALCNTMNGRPSHGIKTTLVLGERALNMLSIGAQPNRRMAHFVLEKNAEGIQKPVGDICPRTLKATPFPKPP